MPGTVQASLMNGTEADPWMFTQLAQQDIAWMLAAVAAANPATVGNRTDYPAVQAAAILPYIGLFWPYLDYSNVNAPVLKSYSPAINNGSTAYQPFTNRTAPLFLRFTLDNSASCLLNGVSAEAIVHSLFSSLFVANSTLVTTNARLQLSVDAAHSPRHQSVLLSGLPLCGPNSTVTPPSCSFEVPTATLRFPSGSTLVPFVLSLRSPIVQIVDFNTKLQADLSVCITSQLHGYEAHALAPYIAIIVVQSDKLDKTLVSFVLVGTVSALGLSTNSLAAAFVSQAALGNASLPTLASAYGANVSAQSVTPTYGFSPNTVRCADCDSVSTASSSFSNGYPAGSELVVFYVLSDNYTADTAFALHIRQDIAVNLANLTGIAQQLLLPYVLVTDVHVTADSGAVSSGGRRLLQATHVSVSFVLLGNVSTLSTSSANTTAATLTAATLSEQFSNRVEQGAMQTPNSGANVPAQTVVDTPAESSTGYANGAYSSVGAGSAVLVSVCTLLAALATAVAVLL